MTGGAVFELGWHDPAEPSRVWRAALVRCPYCGAVVLPDDVLEHGAAHRKHDAEHDPGGSE